jgi:hypothetical protein
MEQQQHVWLMLHLRNDPLNLNKECCSLASEKNESVKTIVSFFENILSYVLKVNFDVHSFTLSKSANYKRQRLMLAGVSHIILLN